jgi:hypothetical protein
VPVRFLSVRLLSICALTATAVGLPVATAGSAPKQGKSYNVVVESPEWAGATDGAYTITITNTTGTQQLGSANVTIPTASAGDADFFVTSEPVFVGATAVGASAGRNGKVIELRNLALPPAPAAGSSVTIALGLRMPCVARSYGWGFDARQSNDFSGTPGNVLGPVTGTTGLIVQGSCKLRFVNEPASAEVGDEITPEAFVPDSPDLVSVEAIDGSPTPQRLTWFEQAIGLEAANGPDTLTASDTADDGVATFDGLTLDLSGNYNLIASTTAPGFSDGESADFQIIDDVGHCSASGCTAHVNGSNTSSTLTGSDVTGTGFALVSLNLGTEPVCAGYTPPSTDWYEFQLTVAGDKTIQAFYSKAAMKNYSVNDLQICFASPQSFDAQSGPQPFDYDGDPLTDGDPSDAFPGAEGFVGLLPIGCPLEPPGPCVQSRTGTMGGGAIVTFFVPAEWGDPRYR